MARRSYRTRHSYRSKFEQNVVDQLTKAKVPFEYETERLPYVIPVPHTYCKSCGGKPCWVKKVYVPDFKLTKTGIILEAKGKFDAAGRKKMAAVVDQYPQKDIRMIFMRDNKINPKSKTRYSTWCDERNIKYCIGTIPKSWLKEFKK